MSSQHRGGGSGSFSVRAVGVEPETLHLNRFPGDAPDREPLTAGSSPGLGFGELRTWSYAMSLLHNMSLRSYNLSHLGTSVFSQVERTLTVSLYQDPGAGQRTHKIFTVFIGAH